MARFHTGRLLIGLGVSLSVAGCATSLPRFVPTEPITAANAHRLAPVYKHLFVSYLLETLLLAPESPSGLGAASVDSPRHQLLVQQRWAESLPAGVLTVDLRTGLVVRRTRYPSNADMSGETFYETGDVWFDEPHQLAVLDSGFDGHGAIVLLDLGKDAPRLLAHGPFAAPDHRTYDVPAHPFVDGRRFLIVRGQMNVRPYGPSHLVYLDLENRRLTEEYALAGLGREVGVIGGVGNYVLATWPDNPGSRGEYLLLEARDGRLRPCDRLRVEDGWEPVATDTDSAHNRWALLERYEGQVARLRVYDIPSLRVVKEFNLPGMRSVSQFPRFGNHSFRLIPATGLAAVIPEEEPQMLVVYDLDSGREVGRQPLGRTDYAGRWKVFVDPAGCYLGVVGAQWVQVFAIQPKSS